MSRDAGLLRVFVMLSTGEESAVTIQGDANLLTLREAIREEFMLVPPANQLKVWSPDVNGIALKSRVRVHLADVLKRGEEDREGERSVFVVVPPRDRGELWKRWLEAENVKIVDEVYLEMMEHRNADVVQNAKQARLLYEAVANVPRTRTKAALSAKTKIQLGSWMVDTRNAIIYHAIDDGKLVVVKVPSFGQEKGVLREQMVWDQIKSLKEEEKEEKKSGKEQASLSPLVGPLRTIEFEHVSQPGRVRSGLVMPCYAMTARDWCRRDIPADLALKWGKQVSVGLHLLHSKELAHNDVKPSNIFLDKDLNAYLGDFGAVTPVGTPRHEDSPAYMPEDAGLVGDKKVDFALLVITMLEILGEWTPSNYDAAPQIAELPRKIDEAVPQDEPLRQFLKQLLG